jgi:hypothetical protein
MIAVILIKLNFKVKFYFQIKRKVRFLRHVIIDLSRAVESGFFDDSVGSAPNVLALAVHVQVAHQGIS